MARATSPCSARPTKLPSFAQTLVHRAIERRGIPTGPSWSPARRIIDAALNLIGSATRSGEMPDLPVPQADLPHEGAEIERRRGER